MAIVAHEQGHLEELTISADVSAWSGVKSFDVADDADPTVAFDAVAALAATGLPAIGDAWPGISRLRVRTLAPKCVSDARNQWQVEASYGVFEANPLTEPATFEWDFGTSTETYAFDFSDPPVPVVNSAGEPFAELPRRLAGEIRCTITKNVSGFDAAAAEAVNRTVNSASVSIDGETFGPRQVLIHGVGCGSPQERNGVVFRQLKHVVGIRAATWDDVLADRGYHELDGSGGLREIRKGTPPVRVEQPWPLDGSGAAKANATDEPAKGTFYPYRLASHGGRW